MWSSKVSFINKQHKYFFYKEICTYFCAVIFSKMCMQNIIWLTLLFNLISNEILSKKNQVF